MRVMACAVSALRGAAHAVLFQVLRASLLPSRACKRAAFPYAKGALALATVLPSDAIPTTHSPHGRAGTIVPTWTQGPLGRQGGLSHRMPFAGILERSAPRTDLISSMRLA